MAMLGATKNEKLVESQAVVDPWLYMIKFICDIKHLKLLNHY
jgi:hypothetical protein